MTGMGIIAANGFGIREFSTSLRNGVSGIAWIPILRDLGFSCQVGGIPKGVMAMAGDYLPNDELPAMNEHMIYGCIAAMEAFRDAGLRIPGREEDDVYEDTGALIGTGVGGLDTSAKVVVPKVAAKKTRRMGSTVVERIMASAASAKIGGLLALGNQVSMISSACSTGTEAIILGAQRIASGRAKRMVVGGCEGSDPHIWAGFDAMRVLSSRFNDAPEKASRPLSASACGFVPSGGAGMMVLEERQTALDRGARIYAEVIGTALTSGGMRNGGSITAPSPKGVIRCIRQGILDAGICSREIDYINGHLTATFADPHEVKNWADGLEVSDEKLPYMNATKSLIGHGLGAAGAMESIATVIQLHEGFLHGSPNCEDLHQDIEPYAKSILHQTIDYQAKIAIKASFGFGDVNSCLLLRKNDSE